MKFEVQDHARTNFSLIGNLKLQLKKFKRVADIRKTSD